MLKVDAVIVMRFGVGLTDDERSIVWSNKDEERQEVGGAFQIWINKRAGSFERKGQREGGRKQFN